ncbi:MAG: ParB/RepB/Spo0J family partition protein [Bacilli bacterium]|nr:ParB/RepB/Spo0J family partition protein [Bacilli bacterium]
MTNMLDKEVIEVALDDIIPNRFQPRLAFDEGALNELAKSIKEHGIIQPLVLRKIGNKYEIIAGERRYKAAYIAGLRKVPAVTIDLNDNESAEVAIVENIQRKDLSPIEEAKSYKKLLERGYLTQEQLATRMGKTQATISNKLRLLNLSPKVQDALLNNKISERHARSLLRIEDKSKQEELLDNIIENRINVKDTDDMINEMLSTPKVEEKVYSNPYNEPVKETKDDEFDIDAIMARIQKKIDDLSKDDDNRVVLENNDLEYREPVKHRGFSSSSITYEEPELLEDNTLNMIEDKPDSELAEAKIRELVNALNNQGVKITYDKFKFDNISQFVIKVVDNK